MESQLIVMLIGLVILLVGIIAVQLSGDMGAYHAAYVREFGTVLMLVGLGLMLFGLFWIDDGGTS